MNKSSITPYHRNLQGLAEHYNKKISKLIRFMYSKGIMQKEIAQVLEVNQGVISRDFPLKEENV